MRFETLGEHNFDAFRRLAEHAWRRPTSPQYYRWRYFEAPALTTLLALEGEQCLATISWFERAYRSGERALSCVEPFDWYALPESRRSGAGLRLMKLVQKAGKPILGFGGSDHTRRILPNLGFRPVGEAALFVLPLTGAYVLRNAPLPRLARRVLGRAATAAVSLWFRAPAADTGFEAHRVPRIDASMAAIGGPAGFASVPDPAYYDWVEKGAACGAGQYIPVEVLYEGRRAAWGIGRLFRHSGLLHAAIVELRLARADAALAAAAVRGMTRILARSGADNVRAWSQLPLLSEAYRRAGFRMTSARAQAMVWGPQPAAQEGADFSRIADAAFFPLHDAGTLAPAPAAAGPSRRAKLTGAA
ncbi:MAG: hypothetical protein ACT4P4_07145 [Betaproteobacteria bacterium]